MTVDDIKSDCDPIVKNKDLKFKNFAVTQSLDGTLLDMEGPAIPCGLIAKSIFRDSYKVFLPGVTAPNADVNIFSVFYKKNQFTFFS